MWLRVFVKTVFPALMMGAFFTLLSDDAYAKGWWSGGGGGGSTGGGGTTSGGGTTGGVPEIGAGSAACALALLVGGAYMLKDRFFGTRGDKTAE